MFKGETRLSALPQAIGTGSLPAKSITTHRPRILVVPWQRLSLGPILLLAAILDFFRLDQEGWGNEYYAAAVRSMLQSWHNFFFLSFDPGGFVSIDKPPVGFWIETASARNGRRARGAGMHAQIRNGRGFLDVELARAAVIPQAPRHV